MISKGLDPNTKFDDPLKKKWVAILVKSGVYQDGDNSNDPDFIVDDMQAAFNLIQNHINGVDRSFKDKQDMSILTGRRRSQLMKRLN
jgi:hypothetical protein